MTFLQRIAPTAKHGTWNKEDALTYIQEQSGMYFYREVVKAFLNLLRS
jgi:hypothetical protein